jgi:5'-nucleotidase
MMRVLVTNDDGIDSIGLHELVRSMCELDGDHEIVVAAPDREFSGAGAALGALHEMEPEIVRSSIPDCEAETWAVNGPPGLCVMFARLGAFGPPFDLIVSGINPGANVGRAVYHSGTVGAALTGRNGLVSGVAVSLAVSGFTIEGQAWAEIIKGLDWAPAAKVAQHVVQALLDDLPAEPVVINVNVPEGKLSDMKGWRTAPVGVQPPRSVADAELAPIPGREGAFTVKMTWGQKLDIDPDTDGGLVENGFVAISHLTRLEHEERHDMKRAGLALDSLFS